MESGKSDMTADEVPYTTRAKKVLEFSVAEARSLKHSYVGTEHLLLGLLREEKGVAAQVLEEVDVTIDVARNETIRLLGVELSSMEGGSQANRVRRSRRPRPWTTSAAI